MLFRLKVRTPLYAKHDYWADISPHSLGEENSVEAIFTNRLLVLVMFCSPLGNILTVAEDLLENDGKKFLEMMDRLADRKVQRDDELMDNRGVYEEYDDEEEGEFEDEGPEEVFVVARIQNVRLSFRLFSTD